MTPTRGLAATRPPLAAVLGYRLLGRRPDAAYDDWLRTDLDGRWLPVRSGLTRSVVRVGALLVGWWAGAALGWFTEPAPVAAAALGVVVVVVEVVRAAVGRGTTRLRLFGDKREVGHFQPYTHLEEDR